ncbi:hypothetical protein phiOC_p129 [Ochrobactrum phage vB_OspM_OC]|nr:hypothetical protein phiOC_p129 [Ochrobactrum phage vB_OspM_OC]
MITAKDALELSVIAIDEVMEEISESIETKAKNGLNSLDLIFVYPSKSYECKDVIVDTLERYGFKVSVDNDTLLKYHLTIKW